MSLVDDLSTISFSLVVIQQHLRYVQVYVMRRQTVRLSFDMKEGNWLATFW
jgi:hypothetical protein